ncbi:MAG: ABC transporter substrate-binding protein [Candidatus Nanopelagicales bacterium]
MSIRMKSGRSAVLLSGGLTAAMVLSIVSGVAAAPTPKPSAPVKCASEPGIDATTVKLGIITPKTGAAAPTFLNFTESAQLRLDQENAKGGVFGRKLVATSYDDQGADAVQTLQGNKAVSQDGMFGILAGSSAVGMFATLKQAGVPVMGSPGVPFSTDRNAFSPAGISTPLAATTAVLERIKAAGATKVANINHATPGAATSGNNTALLFPFVPGLTQVLRIADETQGAHDATSTALRIKSSGADATILVMFVDGGVSIGQAMKSQGVTTKANVLSGLTDPSVISRAGSALEGFLGQTSGLVAVGAPVPAMRTYANAMKARGLNPYNSAGTVGYVAADLMIQGLKLAGKCPTRADLITKLRNVDNYKGAGMLPGPISFRPGITPNGNPAKCTWFVQVVNGAPVADKKATCGQIIEFATGKVVN